MRDVVTCEKCGHDNIVEVVVRKPDSTSKQVGYALFGRLLQPRRYNLDVPQVAPWNSPPVQRQEPPRSPLSPGERVYRPFDTEHDVKGTWRFAVRAALPVGGVGVAVTSCVGVNSIVDEAV